MRVLCVTGMPGCGKEEVVRVAQDLGFSVVRMGDTVRGEVARRGLGTSDDVIGGFAHREREAHGFGVWAERTLPRIQGERVLVDGLRGSAELDVFRKAFGDSMTVLAVHASPRTRFERLRGRGRSDAPASWEEFRTRDARELRWGLGDAIASADMMVVNEGDLREFQRRAREALDAVLRGVGNVP